MNLDPKQKKIIHCAAFFLIFSTAASAASLVLLLLYASMASSFPISLASSLGVFCFPDFVAPGMSRKPAQSPTPNSDCLRQYLSVMAFLLASELAAVRSFRVRRSSEDLNAASASARAAAWRDRGRAAKGEEDEEEEEEEVEATALSSAGIGMDSRPRAADGCELREV